MISCAKIIPTIVFNNNSHLPYYFNTNNDIMTPSTHILSVMTIYLAKRGYCNAGVGMSVCIVEKNLHSLEIYHVQVKGQVQGHYKHENHCLSHIILPGCRGDF